jgi:hypothetical protein
MGTLAAENYSSLLQCGSSKRLQLRWQDLKSNNMAASIRKAKQDDNYGASNIVLPCPSS